MNPDNSAGRLAAIVQKLVVNGQIIANASGMVCWARVFEIKDWESHLGQFEVMEFVEQVCKLTCDVERDLRDFAKRNQVDVEDYMEPIRKVRDLAQPARLQTSGYIQNSNISKSEITVLKTLSDLIATQKFEATIEPPQLAGIRGDIEGLITDIRASEMAPDLKKLALVQLEALLTAIRRYEIFGIECLVNELPRLYGMVALNPSMPDGSETGKLWKRFRGVSSIMFTATKMAFTHRKELEAAFVGLHQMLNAVGPEVSQHLLK